MSAATAMPTPSSSTVESVDIKPQPGKQEQFLRCGADIALGGGGAGGGKTWSLLLEPLYHYRVPDFGAVIFRRTYPEIMDKGGMWEESFKVYSPLGGTPNESDAEWVFTLPKGQWSSVKFAHCQHDKDVLNRKGAQIPLIAFDQLESFTEYIFWYLFSRNRSMCGVKPYIRATCNPVPSDDPIGGWLHKMLAWWLDCDCTYCAGLPVDQSGCMTGSGYAREDRSGVIRWFVRAGNDLKWASTAEELQAAYPGTIAKSFTFIPSKVTDNQKLMAADPTYYANLLALPLVEQERLLRGNWKIRPEAGKVFNRAWFQIVEALPHSLRQVRYWDKAGTDEQDNPSAAYTAGVKLGYDSATRTFYVCDVVRGRWNAGEREATIQQTALLDGPGCVQIVEQEPGSGGKESAANTVKSLAGHTVLADKVTGDKATRANPFAAQAYAGNIRILLAPWTQAYIDELHSFDPDKDGYKDQVDASSGAFNFLTLRGGALIVRANGKTVGLPPKETVLSPDEQDRKASQDAAEALARSIQKTGMYWPGRRF